MRRNKTFIIKRLILLLVMMNLMQKHLDVAVKFQFVKISTDTGYLIYKDITNNNAK